jgi:hypothetical protein
VLEVGAGLRDGPGGRARRPAAAGGARPPGLAGAYDQALEPRRRYTTDRIRAAVEAAGLVPEVVRPVNLLGGLAWWAAVRVGHQARPTPALVRLYDRVVVPAERLLERRVRPRFGQSILCVARVPGAEHGEPARPKHERPASGSSP